MGIGLSQAICPKCGHQGMLINTEDWKPVKLKCNRRKCGFEIDLRQFWHEELNPKKLAKDIYDEITNGWSDHERQHWYAYLEDEIAPYFPALYIFLKKFLELDPVTLMPKEASPS